MLAFILWLFAAGGTLAYAQTTAPAPNQLAVARTLFKQAKFQEAATAYRAIIEKEKSPVAWAGLVESYLKADDVKAADESSSQALMALPDSALIHAVRGDVFFRRALLSDAETEYNSALKLDEKCARAWLGKGEISSIVSRPEEAKEAFSKAHQLDPEDGDILYHWAVTLPYPQNIQALEKYLAEFHFDSEEERRKREYLEFTRALAGRSIWIQTKAAAYTDIKLEPIVPSPGKTAGLGAKLTLNGVPVKLLLDTGASWLTISRKLAEKIGARKLSLQSLEGTGGGTASESYLAWVDKVSIGDLEFRDCVVHVSSLLINGSDGIAGTSMLEHNLVTLDVAHHRLMLGPLPKPADGPSTPEVRPFLANSDSTTQMFIFGHIVLVNAQVNHKALGLFVLDTGANTSLLSPDFTRQLGPARHSNLQVRGMSGAGSSTAVEDVTLQFSHTPRPAQILATTDLRSISRNLGTEVSGMIGLSTLERMKVTINYRDGWVNFEDSN